MKFPNSLLINFNHKNRTTIDLYWVMRCLLQNQITISFVEKFVWTSSYTKKNKFLNTPWKFTLIYFNTLYKKDFTEKQKKFYLKLLTPNPKLKHRYLDNNHIITQIYEHLQYPTQRFNYKKLWKLLLMKKSKVRFTKQLIDKTTLKFNLIFFRKEKIYTKLKYSRVPQYDAVSGGAAALFAGFLGYLITEKFGLELTDSGDFWFLILYLSLGMFFCHPLLKMIEDAKTDKSVFSLFWGWEFYVTLLFLTFSSLCYYYHWLTNQKL